jgi:hypothetical protein
VVASYVSAWEPDMKCANILSLAILLMGTCAFSQEPAMGSNAKLALATPPLHMDRTNCPGSGSDSGSESRHSPHLNQSRAAIHRERGNCRSRIQ